MKRILYALLLPILLVGCKKDDFEPVAQIKNLVGRWRLEAVEKSVNGEKVWEKVSDDSPSYLAFRFDGLLLDEKGFSWCCSPDTLVVNGTSFKIKPQDKVPTNPQCALMNCYSCPSWDLEQNDKELIITSTCEYMKYRSRYLRE